MAKSSRRGRAPQVEEEYEEELEEGGGSGDQLMTALLIVAFGFIFTGILVTWYTLHKNFDTPFLGVIQKDPGEMVKAKAKKDFLEEIGEAVADEDEGDYAEEEDTSEEEPAEEDEE
jgi:hypothetical protein